MREAGKGRFVGPDEYRAYLQTPAWRERADAAKARAGWECALCTSSEHLNVHHRTYERLGAERPEDLVVLCRRCHQRHHDVLTASAIQERDEQRQRQRLQAEAIAAWTFYAHFAEVGHVCSCRECVEERASQEAWR